MVRKGNQQKNSVDRKATNRKHTISEPAGAFLSEEKGRPKTHNPKTVDSELSTADNLFRSSSTFGESVTDTNCIGNGKRNVQSSCNDSCREKADDGTPRSAESADTLNNLRDTAGNDISLDASVSRGHFGKLFVSDQSLNLSMLEGLSMENVIGRFRSSAAMVGWSIRQMALVVFNAVNGWLEQQKPQLSTLTTHMYHVLDYVRARFKHVCPIIWIWILHFGRFLLLLSVVWLDCNLRGLNSLVRLGTMSYYTIFWCGALSVTAMAGITKVLIVTVIFAILGLIGMGIGILIIAIFAIVILWLYGSFWTTSLAVLIGGGTFALGHERVALLMTTVYSMHCARSYVGWLGLLLGLNLSFISSDVLLHLLKLVNEHDLPTEQDTENQSGTGHFYGEPFHSPPAEDASTSRRQGVPSTSGCETELTSEDEVVRLLNCSDHYSALGFTRFENIDVSLLKREYRKKAMLVHPDKNMGNEKAAEAFKKLQNAYEVLLDSLKRKTYDDELRREELLNYFRRFHSAFEKNGKHNSFSSSSTQFEGEDDGTHGESRRIACKKCGDFHKWIRTERSKSQARWCQECNDFHQAKDGDGWLEQSFHPFLFGLLQKVDAPCVYVCAESRIYNATEWFICQGMRCPANTHKPSFHVNTSLSSKHSNSSKGTNSSHKAGGGMPSVPNTDETMTEEEFFEWLQNAMQSGGFEAAGSTSNESPSTKSGASSSKSSSAKKKRKGKKQW